ncbi:hypothetical protein PSHT_00726, partial [Puccinia striiformis]
MHSAEHTRTIGTPSSTSRSNTPSTFHQLSSYQQLKRTTSKLFRSLTPTPPAVSPTAQHHSQPINLLYNEPPPSANPSRWRLLNRLRNRNTLPPSFLPPTTTNTEPLPSKLLKTKISPFRSLEYKNLSHHNRICSTSKSLNNINLNGSNRSNKNNTRLKTTQQRRASRQTIYVPMDVDTIDIQRHHHQLKLKRPHSPTEIALSHLDDILRGTRSLDTPKESSTLNYPTLLNQRPPPSTSKPNSNNNSNPSSSSSSANTPIYLNALSPPNRPSRKLNSNSTTTNHRRTQSSSTEFGSRTLTSNSHHPQLQLQTNTNVNNHKVLIHPTTYEAEIERAIIMMIVTLNAWISTRPRHPSCLRRRSPMIGSLILHSTVRSQADSKVNMSTRPSVSSRIRTLLSSVHTVHSNSNSNSNSNSHSRMAMSSLPDFIPGRTIPQLKGLKHKSQAVVPVSHFKRLATLFKTRQLQTSLKHERWDLMAEGLFLMIITSDSELQIEDSIHESQSVTSSRIHGSQAVTKVGDKMYRMGEDLYFSNQQAVRFGKEIAQKNPPHTCSKSMIHLLENLNQLQCIHDLMARSQGEAVYKRLDPGVLLEFLESIRPASTRKDNSSRCFMEMAADLPNTTMGEKVSQLLETTNLMLREPPAALSPAGLLTVDTKQGIPESKILQQYMFRTVNYMELVCCIMHPGYLKSLCHLCNSIIDHKTLLTAGKAMHKDAIMSSLPEFSSEKMTPQLKGFEFRSQVDVSVLNSKRLATLFITEPEIVSPIHSETVTLSSILSQGTKQDIFLHESCFMKLENCPTDQYYGDKIDRIGQDLYYLNYQAATFGQEICQKKPKYTRSKLITQLLENLDLLQSIHEMITRSQEVLVTLQMDKGVVLEFLESIRHDISQKEHTSGTLNRLLLKSHADEVKPLQATPEVHSGTIAKSPLLKMMNCMLRERPSASGPHRLLTINTKQGIPETRILQQTVDYMRQLGKIALCDLNKVIAMEDTLELASSSMTEGASFIAELSHKGYKDSLTNHCHTHVFNNIVKK